MQSIRSENSENVEKIRHFFWIIRNFLNFFVVSLKRAKISEKNRRRFSVRSTNFIYHHSVTSSSLSSEVFNLLKNVGDTPNFVTIIEISFLRKFTKQFVISIIFSHVRLKPVDFIPYLFLNIYIIIEFWIASFNRSTTRYTTLRLYKQNTRTL